MLQLTIIPMVVNHNSYAVILVQRLGHRELGRGPRPSVVLLSMTTSKDSSWRAITPLGDQYEPLLPVGDIDQFQQAATNID